MTRAAYTPAPVRHALRLAVIAIGFAFAQATASAQEVRVTAAAIPDYEFDSARTGVYCPTCNFGEGNSRLAFSDRDGNLWLGQVDFQTGAFVPEDGRGRLLDTNTAPVSHFGNGPEWALSSSGSSLVYTKYLAPHVPTDDKDPPNAALGWAHMVNGSWVTELLPDSRGRATPDGTKDEGDAGPRINYIDAAKEEGVFWRALALAGVETPISSISDITKGNSRRWVAGTRKIILQGHVNTDPRLIDQVFLVDTDTGQLEQLTFDAVSKAGAFMWRAPEYGNEYVFFTMANFRREMWVYRKLLGPDGQRYWTVAKKIKAPKQAGDPTLSQFFWSPEPFVHNGRSYLFTQVSPSANFLDKSVPTQIALTSIDPLRNDFRMLTTDVGRPQGRLRLDPESFITAQGPFIYYNRLLLATTDYPDGINEGVFRVDTKLGPPKF